jgi:hypothetical protein
MSSESFEANYGGNPGLWINPSYASGDSPAGINTVTGVGSFSQLEVGGYGVTVLDSSGGASFMSGDVTISSSAYSIGNNGINIDNAGVIASGSHGSQWSIDAGGIAYLKKISSAGNIPVVSSCGTSPGISGTDMSGTVTVGTGGTATSCTVTFDIAYANTPHCFVNDQTDTVTPRVSAVSTTAFTITKLTAFTAGAVIDYFCVQ